MNKTTNRKRQYDLEDSKICRKESKESRYWLQLSEPDEAGNEDKKKALIQESVELMKIFGSILEKCK